MNKSGARTLLMGGQACVFYGAAEFSRDLDLLILTDSESIARIKSALDDLEAERIAVPAFEPELLERGHAVHFRCAREDVAGLRIDLMSNLRGLDAFEALWQRRNSLLIEGETIDILAPADLVLAKKTQRDKDWPMIRRLVEQNFFLYEESEDPALVDFWLNELRSPEPLIRVVSRHPEAARDANRLAVKAAIEGDLKQVSDALDAEQREERDRDRLYWEPLKKELEEFRRNRRA